MYCMKCGIQLSDDAVFCFKCGTRTSAYSSSSRTSTVMSEEIVAPYDAKSLRCPSCGAPISPRFGEMIITCDFCGNGITLGIQGWKNIQKHTMLSLKVREKEIVEATIHQLMNKGLLRWHVWERSTLEEMNLTYVPYWIISVSARTSIIAVDTVAQAGTVAATAAVLGAAMAGGGRNQHRGSGPLDAIILGGIMTGGVGNTGTIKKAYQLNENHNYPVVALRALTEYQPHDFEFALQERELFDAKKVPKGIKILNGDVSESDAKNQARTLVEQFESQKAHERYHMIQQINTEIDVGDAELLHVPVWFGRYDFKGEKKIVVIVDGNSGAPIHTVGLDD